MIYRLHMISMLAAAALAVQACNLPSERPGGNGDAAAITAAALTVQAQLTRTAQANPQPPVTFTSIPPASPTSPPPPTLTPPPTQACDLAQYIKDVNIPDGTSFPPGTTFTKTWRLRNIGTCTWSGYSLVFDSGDSMSGASPTTMGTVAPGQEVDISISLTSPSANGAYRGYWRVRNASGVLIPVQGGYQSKSFFVDIVVAVTSAGFDLHTRATDASWIGSAGAVTFGGPDSDTNGFVMYKNGERLEDGSTPAKVLEMHPQWVNDGVMSGIYQPYTVTAGEHFKAKIGFLAFPDGSCGAGNAVFQFNYKEAGVIHPLGSWSDSCDGSLVNVDVDLSSLGGHTVQFTLAVLANGSASQDWAVWVSPRVLIP
jgi:hypothetical protein